VTLSEPGFRGLLWSRRKGRGKNEEMRRNGVGREYERRKGVGWGGSGEGDGDSDGGER
jgi:hypothetical protein